MEHNIQLFEHEEFGSVRVVMIDGEPWFVGKDVAEALGYKDHINALKTHVDGEDKRGWQITTPLGGAQTMTVINEAGLYSLIFGSQLEAAKKFKHWVTHEVLPSIRKTGTYNLPSVTDFNPLAQAISELTAVEREKMLHERDDFAKAQLLRELASASGDERYVRSKLVRTAANLIMGDDFFKKIPEEDIEHICV